MLQFLLQRKISRPLQHVVNVLVYHFLMKKVLYALKLKTKLVVSLKYLEEIPEQVVDVSKF